MLERLINSKTVVIGVIFLTLLFCAVMFLPESLLFPIQMAQVENRVNAAIQMYPSAELRFEEAREQNTRWIVNKFIYWVDAPFDAVKNFSFVSSSRKHSDPRLNDDAVETDSYLQTTYYLSDLPQKEVDSLLYFKHDLCCYGSVPSKIIPISFYIIDTHWQGDLPYLLSELNYANLAGNETTGTYIVYTYPVR